MRLLKYLLFIVATILSVSIIYLIFGYSFIYFFKLHWFFRLLLILFIGSSIFYIPTLVTYYLSKLSPNKNFGFWWITINFILQAIFSLYTLLTSQYLQYFLKHKLFFLLLIILIVVLTYNSIMGAFLYKKEDSELDNKQQSL